MKSKAIAFGIMFALVIVGIAGIASAEKKEAKKSADHLYLYEKDRERHNADFIPIRGRSWRTVRGGK